MSILIKGMEMPKSCTDCRFLVDGWCYAALPGSKEERIRTSFYCPLVEVPTPHGRLIDADEFIKGHCNLCDGACENTYCDCLSCKETMRCDMIQDFSNAPTIIESEGCNNGACSADETSEKVQDGE